MVYCDKKLGGVERWFITPPKDALMRIDDAVQESVVFVGLVSNTPNNEYEISFKATAFFVGVGIESGARGYGHSYLVTARHVAERLEGRDWIIRANTRDGKSAMMIGNNTKWWYHPDDDTVDVAVTPLILPFDKFKFQVLPASMLVTDAHIPAFNLGAGDEVYIIGLFGFVSGSDKNLPIVRTGTLAMMPDERVPTAFGLIEAYLIEARSIGGLSGSPVLVRSSMELEGEPTNMIGMQKGSYLLGLVHGHWDIPAEAKNEGTIEDKHSPGAVNIGIALVVPAKKILEVLNQPELVAMREKNEEQRKSQGSNSSTLDMIDDESDSVNEIVQENPTHLEDFNRLLKRAAPDASKENQT